MYLFLVIFFEMTDSFTQTRRNAILVLKYDCFAVYLGYGIIYRFFSFFLKNVFLLGYKLQKVRSLRKKIARLYVVLLLVLLLLYYYAITILLLYITSMYLLSIQPSVQCTW